MKIAYKLLGISLMMFLFFGVLQAQYNSLEEAFRNKEDATTLRLAGNDLDEQQLIEQLSALTKLEELTIQSNVLTSLPDDIGNLTKLQKLDITANALISLPASISRLNNLESLTLKVNSVTELPDGLENLQGVKELIIHFGGEVLPKSVFQLRNLQSLEIKGPKVQVFPEDMSNLQQLQKLSLTGIPLKIIPQSFDQLDQLKSLDLYDCDFVGSGAFLFDGKSYDLLGIHRCKNIDIAMVENCKAIKKLIFQDSYLTSLPKKFHKMNGLEILEISGERIEDLEVAWKCKNLKTLTVGYNKKVKKLPSKMNRLKDLENLHLSCHSLSTIPEDIEELTQLKVLFIHSNQLSKLPQDAMSNLESLQVLHLNCPKLREVPAFIKELSNLKEVVLSRMNYSADQVEEIKSLNPNANVRIIP